MTAAKPLYTTHGVELFEKPDGRVYGYRGSNLVGATWPIGDVWWAQRVGEPEPCRELTRHAGIAYFVGGCPDCCPSRSRGQTVNDQSAILERFWSKINKAGPMPSTLQHRGPCWIWMAGCNDKGYGSFAPTKKNRVYAHRYAWELLRGEIPSGLVIDHLCRNTRCVNPDHLDPVTQATNIRRGLGFSVFNAMKTHCPKRHPYDEANTYIRPSGARLCRACAREYDRQPHRRRALRSRPREAA